MVFLSFVYLFIFYLRLKAEEKTDQHLNPLKVLHIAEEVMSDDTVMVADGGDFVATAAYILRSVHPVHSW